jgi:hypothetical protein
MSNGSDSKNVEEQQAEQQAEQPAAQPATPPSKTFVADQDHAAIRAEAERKRRIQSLELQRERILSERTSSPHRRNALEIALGEIERLLQELGYTLKL